MTDAGSNLKALLWDVDGTLAETERDGHLLAFNQAFEASGLPWRWSPEQYGDLLRITGGRERILHDMAQHRRGPALAREREDLARQLHALKNRLYAQIIEGAGLPLRDGVRELLDECRTVGVTLAIVTTTSRANVQALLQAHLGKDWAQWFPVMVCGEDVRSKKPDPEAYLRALRALGIGPLQALAIEDSPGGAAAARAAEVPVIVARSRYFANVAFEGVTAIGPGLCTRQGWLPPPPDAATQPGRVTLSDLVRWHAAMDTVSHYP